MYIINDLTLQFFIVTFLIHVSDAVPNVKANNEQCVGRTASCDANAGPRRAVCGTDGRTYQTRCHLLRAQCSGEPVALARKGPCAEGQSSCLIALRYALNGQGGRRANFVPRCRADGTYAAVQCAAAGAGAAAGCWCVTPDGKPLQDTAVRNGRPDCTKTDGTYAAVQCAAAGAGAAAGCWCVAPDGKPLQDTAVRNGRPDCTKTDGTYAAVQCAAADAGAAAGCWCVAPDGKPLQDTAVRNGRPYCTKTGKSHTRRRSSVRGQRNKRSCSRSDRVLFNANLIKIFSVEYERARLGSGAMEPRAVADWKFGELDRDRSGALQKPEYRGLRRLIKKVVKPKRCARAWARGCDADGDGEIALAEWAACLLANPEPPAPDYEDSGPEPELDYGEEEPPQDPSAVLPGNIRHSFAPDGSEAEAHREDEANDCLTDRQAVLDEQKAGAAALYVPECTGDGRYARAQCYRSTGYCWCVHQDTGKPIPGSSVKDRRPDCDAAPHHASPMRGCPEPMKSNFLRDLMRFFITKMTATTNGTGPGEIVKWGASKEEQAATWTYVMLDKDKNKALERREWKSFHQLIANMEPLRRCGRKLPRYCDINHDSKITITEWMACLEVTQLPLSQTTEPAKVSNPRRKGPNPLESILKADD